MDTGGVVDFLHEQDVVAEYVENMKCQTTVGLKSHPTMWRGYTMLTLVGL